MRLLELCRTPRLPGDFCCVGEKCILKQKNEHLHVSNHNYQVVLSAINSSYISLSIVYSLIVASVFDLINFEGMMSHDSIYSPRL